MRPESMVKVKLQQPADGQDDIGQPATVWSDVATIGADIRHKTGLEEIKGDAQTSTVKASVRVRYRDGITAGMRLLHGATAYNIISVLPDVGRREYVDLVCEVVQ